MDAGLLDVITDAIRSVSKRTQTMAITNGSQLVEDLALDSLDLVGVMMKLEDRLSLSIDLDSVGNIQTVGDLGAHLDVLRSGRASAA